MVQTALGTLAPVLAGAGSALAHQSKRELARPQMPSDGALILSQAKDRKQTNNIKRELDKERLYALLAQPEFIGLAITFGGILAAQNIKFSDSVVTNEGMQALASASSVLLGLGYAGVGDLTTLIVALMAGGFSMLDHLGDVITETTEEVAEGVTKTLWNMPVEILKDIVSFGLW